jgi:epoxyqueuosine reductase
VTPVAGLPSDPAIEFREAIRARGLDLGFSRVGFTTADPLDDATQRRWRRWLDRDVAGEMDYLRRPSPRRTHPRDLLPEARSVIVVAAGYYQGDHAEPMGKIARYAWGEDYHHVLRDRLGELARWIEAEAPRRGCAEKIRWRAFTDSAPLDERALAVRAGLGFFGKNTLLLDSRQGSWMLLAELLVSLPLPPDEAQPAGQCGACRKCLDACPTDAFTGPYEMDPRRCTSYLTIEQRGPIPDEVIPKLKGWAFGCDICQEVCPFNATPLARRLPQFAPDRGAGPNADERLWEGIDSKKAFTRKWAKSPLSRPGLEGMRRNLEAARADVAPERQNEVSESGG